MSSGKRKLESNNKSIHTKKIKYDDINETVNKFKNKRDQQQYIQIFHTLQVAELTKHMVKDINAFISYLAVGFLILCPGCKQNSVITTSRGLVQGRQTIKCVNRECQYPPVRIWKCCIKGCKKMHTISINIPHCDYRYKIESFCVLCDHWYCNKHQKGFDCKICSIWYCYHCDEKQHNGLCHECNSQFCEICLCTLYCCECR